MSSGIWIAASGATGQMTALDVAANNTANASTNGFKAEQALFQEALVDAARAGNAAQAMRYNSVAGVGSDLREGPVRVTERPLDFAIRGEGFFAVQTSAGERYTRAGSLQVSPSGELVTADGSRVLNTARRPIQVAPGAGDVAVSATGTILSDGAPVGQLRLVRFAEPVRLEREGHFLFRATAASGAARPAALTLETGALEMSNVSVVKGMTEIVSTTRTFDALEKAIEVFRAADQRAANDLMRKR